MQGLHMYFLKRLDLVLVFWRSNMSSAFWWCKRWKQYGWVVVVPLSWINGLTFVNIHSSTSLLHVEMVLIFFEMLIAKRKKRYRVPISSIEGHYWRGWTLQWCAGDHFKFSFTFHSCKFKCKCQIEILFFLNIL